jgi:hypothetical protein
MSIDHIHSLITLLARVPFHLNLYFIFLYDVLDSKASDGEKSLFIISFPS